VATAPDELTVWLNLVQFPGAEPMVTIDATFLGPEGEARELLAPLDRLPAPLSDTRRVMSVAELGSITGEPTDPSPGLSRAELLTDLNDTAVKALLETPIAPLLAVQVRQLGGAFTRPSDSPHGTLVEPYALYLFGIPRDAATAEAVVAKQAALAGALPVSGRKPVTFLNPTESFEDAFSPEVVARLRELKRRHDPQRVFRSNFQL
jgi:hypothetical protein